MAEGDIARDWLRALALTRPIEQNPLRTFPAVVSELAERFGDAPALVAEGERFSFRELHERSNRYARWALAQKLNPGEAVCLSMSNRPEYMAIWLGITRVGGVAALVNTNLVGASLAHCINTVSPKHLIVEDGIAERVVEVASQLREMPTIWSHGGGEASFQNLATEIAALDGALLDSRECTPVTIEDRALLVYTSGTTGLPKAAPISHYRLMVWIHWFAGMLNTVPGDRIYNCLPMYHSVGGTVATGAALVNGGAVVIRKSFSVSRFWEDVVQSECTLFQYIGEMCRHLVNAPTHSLERRHRLRLCCGNGLREDIWERFRQRFEIPRILEFYAATEANISLFNAEGRPGSIGRVPSFIAHRSSIALVKLDLSGEKPLRDEEGFCVRCAPNETGEALGRMPDSDTEHLGRFEGYTDARETERKILRHAFKEGDAWYRTGDLMRRDPDGYYFFVDRIGDTFRWKGENVATSEVAAVLSSYSGIVEANVYGIEIPAADGRAGLAEIVCSRQIDLSALRDHLTRHLPRFAIPVLLRMRERIDVTSTFKQLKSTRTLDGLDPSRCADSLYIHDPGRCTYVALDQACYSRLIAGKLRL